MLAPAFLNWRLRSLARGNFFVLGSLAAALYLSHFPNLRVSWWLLAAIGGIALGTGDTARCMRKRWDFYHGAVILCLYMDLMAFVLAIFLLVFPALT